MDAADFYQKQLEVLNDAKTRFSTRKKVIGIARLSCIIIIGLVIFFLYPYGWGWLLGTTLILAFIFLQLVLKDIANNAALAHNSHLIQINELELKALDHDYLSFENGSEHAPKEHAYANDLDIFGHASVFQFLNRTVSEPGSSQLAEWLLAPAMATEIPLRQQAVKELCGKISWAQQLQAFGKETKLTLGTRDRLQDWLLQPSSFGHFKHWQWLRYVLPFISTSITIATIFGLLPINVFYVTMLLMASVAIPLERRIHLLHNRLSKTVHELQTFSKSIAAVEKEKFTSDYLIKIKQVYRHEEVPASQKINQLKGILDRLDLRFNMVLFIPLNLLFLWNLQQALQLDNWKKENKLEAGYWFDMLGRMEALISLAVACFNNPAWVFPELQTTHFYIEAEALGHPLISPGKRVNNFIDIKSKAAIMLVTGSNMAGKSTYLRSVGVNVVLAMAGTSVCAEKFILSPVQLMSSMRIADNLEESASTFYAELKKLKTVIDEVNKKEKVFILLDEILRGTNSYDRHTGSEALIQQLIKHDAAAIIATHDVGLANLEEKYPHNIENFHFDVQVNDEELYFDYKLKTGVCTSLNASILMKKIGIEL